MGAGAAGLVALVLVLTTLGVGPLSSASPSQQPLPLAGDLADGPSLGTYLGPTAFVTSPLGHTVCDAYANGSLCLTPVLWRVAADPKAYTVDLCAPHCRAQVVDVRIVNSSRDPYHVDVDSDSMWLEAIEPIYQGYVSFGARITGGRGCAPAEGGSVSVAPHRAVLACIAFDDINERVASTGGDVTWGSMQIGGIAQWARPDAQFAEGDATVPQAYVQPMSPALLAAHDRAFPNTYAFGDPGLSEFGGWALDVTWTYEEVTNLAGTSLHYVPGGPVGGALSREYGELCGAGSGGCDGGGQSGPYPSQPVAPLSLSARPDDGAIVLHYEIAGTKPAYDWPSSHSSSFIVTAGEAFADVQYACTPTGCSVARVGSTTDVDARGCDSYTSLTVHDSATHPTGPRSYCIVFQTPRSAVLQDYGFLQDVHLVGEPDIPKWSEGTDVVGWFVVNHHVA